jgi:surfeit locus 1 family protein
VIPLVTFCLGTWQVQRRKQKLALIDELETKTRATPVPFPVELAEIPSLEYRRVKVRGRFDHSQELYVMPRAPVDAPMNPSFGSASQSGANVITAFTLSDYDVRILVNRGWVPRNKLKPESRPEGQIEDEVELVGVVRKSESRQPFTPNNDMAHNRWYYKDLDAMATLLNTAPVLIDADRNSTVSGGPIGGQTRVTLRNEHLSYIFTWYSLSALTSFMWFKMYWK